jgi:23S rRNA pseudouridine955/2504/2580 synthase
LNKPVGLSDHGPGENLEALVRSFLVERLPKSLSFKPGPLHRLDKPTSGIIVFSTSLEGARQFSALLQERQVRKRYLALVDGTLDAPALWEDRLFRDKGERKTFIAGPNADAQVRKAGTRVAPLLNNGSYSLITAEIRTGRTHQIRSQAAFHGHPLSGDQKYGGSKMSHSFFLHAHTLEFPVMGTLVSIRAPIPRAFDLKLQELFGSAAGKGIWAGA